MKSSVACNFVISFWGRFVIGEGFPKKEEKGKKLFLEWEVLENTHRKS